MLRVRAHLTRFSNCPGHEVVLEPAHAVGRDGRRVADPGDARHQSAASSSPTPPASDPAPPSTTLPASDPAPPTTTPPSSDPAPPTTTPPASDPAPPTTTPPPPDPAPTPTRASSAWTGSAGPRSFEADSADRGGGRALGRDGTHRASAVLLERAPLECARPDQIHERLEHRERKDHDQHEAEEGPSPTVSDRPRIEEHDLDVEDDEDHRNQEEPDREALRRPRGSG